MTTPIPSAYAQFGYTLALAERTLTKVLRQHLAERGAEPETWYALQLIAVNGPAIGAAELRAELAGSATLNPELAAQLLARLEAEGLISGSSEISLTAAGDALYRSLRDYIAAPRVRLLSEFSSADIETTVRTLRRVAERAAEDSAAPGAGAIAT
jgi:DNA-binding MarR family transcriptional regulator